MEDLDPYWPETDADESGIFFTCHDVELDLHDAESWADWIREVIEDEGFELARIDYIFCSDEFLLRSNRRRIRPHFRRIFVWHPSS